MKNLYNTYVCAGRKQLYTGMGYIFQKLGDISPSWTLLRGSELHLSSGNAHSHTDRHGRVAVSRFKRAVALCICVRPFDVLRFKIREPGSA